MEIEENKIQGDVNFSSSDVKIKYFEDQTIGFKNFDLMLEENKKSFVSDIYRDYLTIGKARNMAPKNCNSYPDAIFK